MHAELKLHHTDIVVIVGQALSPANLLAACGILLASLVATAPVSAQVGLGLAPMRVELRLAAGSQYTGALALTSDSEGAVRVVAGALDFFIDATGNPQFSPVVSSEADYTCRDWLALNPMEMELPRSVPTLVRYTLRVSAGAAARSYHCAAGFTTVPTAGDLKTTGLKSAVRIVAVFYVVVGNPPIEGTIEGLQLRYDKEGQDAGWRAVVSIRNSGLMYFRPEGELQVLDAAGTAVESASFVPMPVLPRRVQEFPFPLKLSAGPGAYTLRVRVDLGGDEIQEATAAVTAERPAP